MYETDTLESHLAHHEAELDALRRICGQLGQYTGQNEKFAAVLDVLEQDLSFERATLMLRSPDGRELFIEATTTVDPTHLEKRYGEGEGITGRVLHTGVAAVIPRISQDPSFKNRIHQRKRKTCAEYSFICNPIILDKEVIGTLSADLPFMGETCTQESQRVLSIVSGLIANDVKIRRIARMNQEALRAENERLRDQLGEIHRPENLIGNSREMQVVYRKINQVATSDTTVLVQGESGTGKELVASAIHYGSLRSDNPFIKVNCAALNESLLESELFGHEKGAFTGAMSERVGRIEQADGGTLFLDEIGEFSPSVQVKLLRVLQERELERVGGNEVRPVNVRIIAATNRSLEEACERGEFRQDLYFRINVFPIHLPGLRERSSDILLLADHFVSQYAGKMGKEVKRISTNTIAMLNAYHWPGNVRELANCIEYAVLVCEDGVIHGSHLPPALQLPEDPEKPPRGTLKQRVSLLEKDLIIDALKRTGGNVTTAAEQLGITPRMVRYKIKNLNIPYPKYFRQ